MLSEPASSTCCAFCDGTAMTEIIDFGRVALAGGFLETGTVRQRGFLPAAVVLLPRLLCGAGHRQGQRERSVRQTISTFLRRSRRCGSTSRATPPRSLLASSKPERSTAIEFGCNDGVLLRPLADQKIRTVIGVDPATNVVKTIDDPRITVVNDFFNEAVAERIVAAHGKADIVVANNVYAHIPDIQGVTRAVRDVLGGRWGVHFRGALSREGDRRAAVRHDLSRAPLLLLAARADEALRPVRHDGFRRQASCRSMAARCGSMSARRVAGTPRYRPLRWRSRRTSANDVTIKSDTFIRFAGQVAEHKAKLMGLLKRLKGEGHTIAGYGASGRANTMIQYCGIDHRHLDVHDRRCAGEGRVLYAGVALRDSLELDPRVDPIRRIIC